MGVLARKLMDAPASGGGSSYSCTITIGNDSIFGFIKYEFGSIDAEPIPGEVLTAVFWNAIIEAPQVSAIFLGDVTGLIGSLDLWIGGVNYGGAGSWIYFEEDDITIYEYYSATPSATSGTILLELK